MRFIFVKNPSVIYSFASGVDIEFLMEEFKRSIL